MLAVLLNIIVLFTGLEAQVAPGFDVLRSACCPTSCYNNLHVTSIYRGALFPTVATVLGGLASGLGVYDAAPPPHKLNKMRFVEAQERPTS